MADSKTDQKTHRKSCNGCGGSGQISFFRGVSRFVMDWDDCEECQGTGYVETVRDGTVKSPETRDPND